MNATRHRLVWAAPEFGPDPTKPTSTWSAGGRARDVRLRLLGALRGPGLLCWPGGWTPVDYELDVYRRGDACMASGSLEGDFAALRCIIETGEGCAVRLRVSDGWEIEIELVELEAEAASFDVCSPLDDAGALLLRHAG